MGVAHLRIELFGTVAGGAEHWSAGFSTAPPGGGGLADVAVLSNLASNLFDADFFGAVGINGLFRSSVVFIGARARQLNSAGVTVAVAEDVLTTPTAGGAGGGAESLPPQVSEVISLRTSSPGARHRGRMYLPPLASNCLTANGRLDSSVRTTVLNGMKDFFDDWNADANTLPVAVASNAGSFVETVTHIQLGDVFDTQRRRRDRLPESYASVNLA